MPAITRSGHCENCGHDSQSNNLFCQECGAVLDKDALRSVRLMGPIGVAHSNSPKIDAFLSSGDPSHLD